MTKIYSFLFVVVVLVVGCSPEKLIENQREKAFFDRVVNDSKDFKQAEQKMNQLQVLTSNQIYNMRYALFDNGKFYYQVDKLGNGEGTWEYKEGFVKLHATRKVFDMNINLVATSSQGEGMAMQFLDRHGLNSVGVENVKPQTQSMEKFKPSKNPAL